MDLSADVRAGDRVQFLATLFAPEPVRPALHALAAYRIELGRVVATARDPLAAEIRLQWWRDAIRDQGFGEGAAVPLVLALREAMARYGWPADTLVAMSEAHIHDLYADPFADFDAFDGYAGETHGAAVQLTAMALSVHALGEGAGYDAARTAARAAGYAGVALTSLAAARRFVPRFHAGHTLAPESVLRETVDGDIAQHLTEGTLPERAEATVIALLDHGEAAHEAMRGLLPGVAAPARAAFLTAIAARQPLGAIRRRPLAPPESGGWREQFALWRAARTVNRL
ncbi:squalene/phytoene synthase family protein [Acuticoccus kandeliae]|uniref:squalene/phytoene synthase family protein n=1 Tax=Acuticoccus kandeliae TaxID=2073160 RepID=UPI00130027BF|nr:squalene/phytoene synthase family protein [Acuticoccus kandeliae]